MSYEELSGHVSDIWDKAVEDYMMERGAYKTDDNRYIGSMGVDDEILQLWIDEAESKFAKVYTMFGDFYSLPDPADFDGPIADLKTTMSALCASTGNDDPIKGEFYPANTELTAMTDAAGYLDEWDGVAVTRFRENFVTPFPQRTSNQFVIASILMNALEAEQELWKRVRENIDKIAEDCIKALDHMHDCGKNEWSMAFSVAGAVVAIAALPLTAGTSGALALAAVGSGIGVASTYAGQIDDPPEPRFSGESAEAVVNATEDGIDKLKEEIEKQEQKVVDAMTNALGTVNAHVEDIVAPRPSIADDPTPDPGYPDAD
ncbi:hypothetical protein [Nocardioides bigeumensis]|uniref:WXG100 family type VII secretion target n=1 Tax=Nocardioides bigeumensis TaxID=433657 RepID=A0ABN2XZA2_9ACTN